MKSTGLMYQSWWKVLGALLMIYTYVVGFYVPLRPGIVEVSKTVLTSGESYSIDVKAYNANFSHPDAKLSAYLRVDNAHMSRVPYVTVTDRNTVNLKGQVPSDYPWEDDVLTATLVLQDQVDGFIVYPPGVVIQKGAGLSTSTSSWGDALSADTSVWTFKFPYVGNLWETIRNTFFHVAIWMAMFVLLIISLVYSIRYLRSADLIHDAIASSFTEVAMVLGMAGMITGSFWAKATWGTYWTNDPKLNLSAVAVMIYMAYLILRGSLSDQDQRAKVSAAYNVFAFVAMIPLIFIIPRLTDSMHPGNGGNPALGGEDLDSTLRLVFYPTILGYTLMSIWLSSLIYRVKRISIKRLEHNLQVS